MKICWIHGVSRLRSPSMSKWVEYLLPEITRKSPEYDIFVDEIKGIPVPYPLKLAVNRYTLYSLHARNLSADLFHVHDHGNSHVLSMLPEGKPKIITVHDLYMFDLHPGNPKSLLFRHLNLPGIMKATHIIAVSSYMKGQIVKRFSISPEKVSVVYCGIDHSRYVPKEGGEEILSGYGVGKGERYLLFVGAEIARKNFDSVLAVFKRLVKKHDDLMLVKVGNPESRRGHARSLRIIEEAGLKKRVLFCGYVPEEHLPYLYSHAQALLAPSYYEGGCGMHVVEAMACGCPVVASNIPQAIELTGDAVLSCNPHDLDDIYEKTAALLEDGKLREDMVTKGLRKAREFSWDKASEKHLSIYAEYLV